MTFDILLLGNADLDSLLADSDIETFDQLRRHLNELRYFIRQSLVIEEGFCYFYWLTTTRAASRNPKTSILLSRDDEDSAFVDVAQRIDLSMPNTDSGRYGTAPRGRNERSRLAGERYLIFDVDLF